MRIPGIFRQALIRTCPCSPTPSKATLISSGFLPAPVRPRTIGENASPAVAAAAAECKKPRLSILVCVLRLFIPYPFQSRERRTHVHLHQHKQLEYRVYNLPSVNLDALRKAFGIRKIFFSLRICAISASDNYKRLIPQFCSPLLGFFRLVPGFVEVD